MNDRIVLLVNPDRDDVVERLVELVGRDLDRLEPQDPADIASTVAQAVADGVAVVGAIGGDGTQRTVADALVGSNTRLGVIPGGTVNLLAKVLGVSELDAAAAALTSGDQRPIDVATCNGTTFVLNASSGYDADVIARADNGLKNRWGRLGFVAAAAMQFRHRRATEVRIDIDGTERFVGRAITVIVTNVAQRASADLLIAPGASVDDGLLHVLAIQAHTLRSLAGVIVDVVRRRPTDRDDAVRFTASSVCVSGRAPCVDRSTVTRSTSPCASITQSAPERCSSVADAGSAHRCDRPFSTETPHDRSLQLASIRRRHGAPKSPSQPGASPGDSSSEVPPPAPGSDALVRSLRSVAGDSARKAQNRLASTVGQSAGRRYASMVGLSGRAYQRGRRRPLSLVVPAGRVFSIHSR